MTASDDVRSGGGGAGSRLRRLVTPEGVDLRLRIGDAGERAGAFILDITFLALALGACTLVAWVLTAALFLSPRPEMAQAMAAIWLLGFFVVSNAYFIVFELGPRAATPGKRIMGLRVAARDGGRLTAEAVFARNAMREIEVFLPLQFIGASAAGAVDPIAGALVLLGLVWSGLFALFPLLNRDRLRVGDLVAGTWVVKAPRGRLSADLLDALQRGREQPLAFTAEQAGAYGVKELHVLEDVLRRRDSRTMEAVAQRIRARIGWRAVEAEGDEAFLDAYYASLRARLERRLLFGHRRRDKFDAG
ncbi:MAG TPA: RDD family protein [Caulobacteraceae bacterium]|nr:RDD family protein [Caulobacteraceae bacterium]